jgi:DNA-binding protein HU-beta
MNRSELIAAVAQETGLSAQQAGDAVSATFDAVVAAVAKGDAVTLSGFGTFDRRERAARAGRNPQTGEAMEIPASVAPGFKAAAGFKRAVAGA